MFAHDHITRTQALEQNYITFKALSLGAGQQQQQGGAAAAAPASIAALGGAESSQPAAAAAMDVSDAEDDGSDDDDDDGDAVGMAVDGADEAAAAAAGGSSGAGGRRGKSKVSPEFKELVMGVLTSNGFEQMRPAKMTQEDFLKLLADFNAAGIHFS